MADMSKPPKLKIAQSFCCHASNFDVFSSLMNFKGGLAPLILQNLLRGPNHGYRFAQEVKREGQGLISSYTQEENGRTRCYYKLTEKGKRSLATQKQEWLQFSSAIDLLLQEAS